MRRVLVLSYHFPPIGGAGAQRPLKLVRLLRGHGYSSLVVTGPGVAADRWTPNDDALAAEAADCEVQRLAGPEPTISEGWHGRGERWLGLRRPWVDWWAKGTVGLGSAATDVDLIYAWMQPYESAEPAMELARRLGRPWVADLGDPWALDEMVVYPSRLHRVQAARTMRRALADADAIVMSTPEAARRVKESFPELRDRPIAVIPNGYDADDFAGPAPSRDDARFRIVHTGYLHTELGQQQRRTQRLRDLLGGAMPGVQILTRSHVYLLEALGRLVAEEPELRDRIELHLAGVATASDREVAGSGAVPVHMPGYLAHDRSVAMLRSADLLFLPMHDLPEGVRATIVPGKTYEYMASGRPILAAVPAGDAHDILAATGTAALCRPTDVAAMAEIVRAQLARVAAGAPAPVADRSVVDRYSYQSLAGELAGVFDEALARSPRALPGGRVGPAQQPAAPDVKSRA